MIRVLPACVFRRFVPRESICYHKENAAHFVKIDECETCPLVGLVAAPVAERQTAEPIFTTRCQHLGEQLRTAKCEPCGGAKTTPVFLCDIHSECQPTKRAAGVRSCLTCADFADKIRA